MVAREFGWFVTLATMFGTVHASAQVKSYEERAPRYAMPAPDEAMGLDAAPTPLRVETDADVPYWSGMIVGDALGPLFGRYAATFGFALSRHHAAAVTPMLLFRDGRSSFGFDLGYRLTPLGRGLDGLWIGPTAGVGLGLGDTWRAVGASVGLEAGWTWILRGVSLGLAGGAGYSFAAAKGAQGGALWSGWEPRIRVLIGYAWM